MQTLARVQVQIRERRLRQTEDNEAHRKKIQQKYEKDQAKIIEKSEVFNISHCSLFGYAFWYYVCVR